MIVSKKVLKSHGADFDKRGLDLYKSPWVAGGPDQIQVEGPWRMLSEALAGEPLRTAARELAERLMVNNTGYSRYHDDHFAGRVLGRS